MKLSVEGGVWLDFRLRIALCLVIIWTVVATGSVCDAARVEFGLPSESVKCNNSPPWEATPYILGATAVLYANDEPIQRSVQAARSPETDALAATFKPFGDFSYMITPLAGLYLVGVLADDRAERTARDSVLSVITGGAVTTLLKVTVRRPRPSAREEEEGLGFGRTGLSFPSGHTTVAFAIATVVASEYRHTKVVPVLAYTSAALTGWSRVNDNAHWSSDVLFGAAVGYFAAKSVMDSNDGITASDSSLTQTPIGLHLTQKF